MIRSTILLLLMLFSAVSHADEITILPLHHRLPEQVLPTLEPLVAPGGSIVGANNQLFVRTTAENLAQLQQVLAMLDTPLHRLLITVRQSRQQQQTDRQAAIDGLSVTTGKQHQVQLQGSLQQGSRQLDNDIRQQIQTLDGSPASIFLGEQYPVAMMVYSQDPQQPIRQDVIHYVDIGSGFTATPRVVGQNVVLTIQPVQQLREQGQISSSTLSSEISGPLGSWISLGGTTQQHSQSAQSLLGAGSGRGNQQTQVWLKVDLLD